jgi:hypothetical protein
MPVPRASPVGLMWQMKSDVKLVFGCGQSGYPTFRLRGRSGSGHDNEVTKMIVLGLILLVVGFFTGISILTTIGVILLVVGVILAILGATGRAVGGRAHWY